MNDSRYDILNQVPLVEVMRGWGYVAVRDGETSASYICPWHDDHRPSLVVDKVVRHKATDLGFKCFACGQEGYGAVQLAARLMGFPAGMVPKEDLGRVEHEIAVRCNVELPTADGEKKHYDTLRTSLEGWSEFCEQEKPYADMAEGEARFERGEWTEEGLKALGLKVELATRKARKKDIKAGDQTGQTATDQTTPNPIPEQSSPTRSLSYSGGETYGGGGSALPAIAEVRVGDMLTQFDPDTGAPLYRCSLEGKGFYRGPGAASARTIAEWGADVERLFGVQPVARFLKRIKPEKGGAAVRIVRATRNYPIFMFDYPWGVKKYEPRDVYGNKWTWFNVREDSDLNHRWYADAMLADALEGAVPEQDERHPYADVKDKDGKPTGKVRFERVVLCSGPRDAIAVYSHSNAHVIWLHSEQAGFDGKGGNTRPNRWLRKLIKRLASVTADGCLYVCYDEDATGLAASQAIALNSPQVKWLRLPKELTQTISHQTSDIRHLKDVTDFVTRFGEVEGLMPAEVQHDDPVEWFENALFDTPSCQFWQWESERKDADGKGRIRYKFDLRNTPVFLRARGMVRKVMQQGKESFSRYFLMGNDNIYTECFPGAKGSNKLVAQARELMAEWLRAHKECNDCKGALSRAIFSAKLETSIMESIEQVDFDDRSFGEDFDYFFFKNCAVRVTKDEIKTVPYSQMKWWTNSEAILDGSFTRQEQAWHVVENPLYASELEKHEEIMRTASTKEEREQENMRWDSWERLWRYLLKLDKPMEEMPVHFRFAYNLSRIFWEKENAGQELTATEKQMHDIRFIGYCHALGRAQIRYRSADHQKSILITDNSTRREDLASGGTGKTVTLDLLALTRRTLSIDGKPLEGGNIVLEQELDKVIPGVHNIVCIDELPAKFSFKKFYNYGLAVTSRGLYQASVRLEGDDLPIFVIATNEQPDLSSDSTLRRLYEVLVGDWYHPRSMDGSRPAHTPADDFRKEGVKEVARNLKPAMLNEARNFLLACAQLYMQHPDETICPPKDARAMLRQALAASKDEEFTRWIDGYLADKRHLGIPIAKRELAISLLDFCGITVGRKTLDAAFARIRNNLDDYIRTSVYVVNPDIVKLTPTDCANKCRRTAAWTYPMNKDGTIQTDDQGNRLPRVLDRKHHELCFYFYRKGRVPSQRYDEAHVGDKDYVQPAPETDPDAEPQGEGAVIV